MDTPGRKPVKTTVSGALAKVFGAHGEHVTRPDELEGAIRRAFACGNSSPCSGIFSRQATFALFVIS